MQRAKEMYGHSKLALPQSNYHHRPPRQNQAMTRFASRNVISRR